MKVRKDLIQLLTMLVIGIVGIVLAYRYGTGQTKAVMTQEAADAKAMKDIANRTPGDAEALLKKLTDEADRLSRDKRQAEERERLAEEERSRRAQPKSDSADSGRKEMSQAELDAAEALRRALASRNSKISAWEDSARAPGVPGNGSGQGNTLTTALAAQASAADRQSSYLTARSNLQNAMAADAASGGGSSGAGVGGSTGTSGFAQDRLSASWSNGNQGREQSPLLPTLALSAYTLHQGALIPAVMLNAVDAELPGDIRATVTTDVYDSITKSHLLIPKGTALIGSYNSEIANGQERLLFGFSRMIFPNGASVNLANMRGSDLAGKAGIRAEVDSRFWQIFGSSLLIGVVTNFTKPLTEWLFPIKASTSTNNSNNAATSSTVVVQKTDPETGDITTTTTNSSNANANTTGTGGTTGSNLNLSLSTAASNTATTALDEVSKRILDRNQNIKPTLRLDRGEKFNIIVARDMVLPPSLTQVSTTSAQ